MHEIEASIAAHRYLPFRFTHEAGPGGPAASPAFGNVTLHPSRPRASSRVLRKLFCFFSFSPSSL
jgi:hypothetical protein